MDAGMTLYFRIHATGTPLQIIEATIPTMALVICLLSL
jgi:hypothetical protein